MPASVVTIITVLICSAIVNLSEGGNAVVTKPFSDACLDCICEGVGCKKENFCEGNVCGLLYITELFWIDAEKPTIPFDDPESDGAYQRCSNDEDCARQAVKNYMRLYPYDCNSDGFIDCYDYGAIHNQGRHGCRSPLSTIFGPKFTKCLKNMPKE